MFSSNSALVNLDLVREAFLEHSRAARQLRRLIEMVDDGDAGFAAQLKKVRTLLTSHMWEEEATLLHKAEPIMGDKRLELLGGQMEARFDELVEEGFEVTLAENAVDLADVDRALAQYAPTMKRVVPAGGNPKHTRLAVNAAARHAGRKMTVKRVAAKGGRTKPKSGAEGARKSREGYPRNR